MSLKLETPIYQQNKVSFGKKTAVENTDKKIKDRSLLAAILSMPILGQLNIKTNKLTNDRFFKSSVYTAEESKTLRTAVNEAFTTSGLKDNGYRIINITDTPVDPKAKPIPWLKNLNEAVIKNPENIEKLYQDVKLINPENKRAFAEYVKMWDNSATPFEKFIFNTKLKFYGCYQEIAQKLKPGTITDSPKMIKLIKRYMLSKSFKPFENGTNAMAVFKEKLFFLPKNGLPATGFHEFGHLLNETKGWNKVLNKGKYMAFAAPLILLMTVFGNTKKETEDNKLTKVQKTVNFVRNNAGKLVLLTQLPLLLDEGIASHTGHKLAKKLLTPELYKKVVKNNAFAFSTYLGVALVSTFNAFAMVKIKDHFKNKYENKVKTQKDAISAKKQIEQKAQTAAVSDLKTPSPADSQVFSKFFRLND